MRKLMRHIRTGKIAVYDADLVEAGRWEAVDETPAPPADPQPPAKTRRGKGGQVDNLAVQDTVSIVLKKADGSVKTI